jgi:hypothetical protein
MLCRPEGYQRYEGFLDGDDCTLLGWKAAANGRLRASLNIVTGVGISNNAVRRRGEVYFGRSCPDPFYPEEIAKSRSFCTADDSDQNCHVEISLWPGGRARAASLTVDNFMFSLVLIFETPELPSRLEHHGIRRIC